MRLFTGNTAITAVLCLAQFVVVLDATVVATALPAIGADLRLDAAQLSWVVTSYTVVFAGLLVLGGRVADLAGARRMFGIGVAVFGVASLVCALAWGPAVLLSGRALQGVGAALLSPAALAALRVLPQRPGHGGAPLGWWTAAGAGGGASGWLVGGVLTQAAGWPWVFAGNVPVCALTLAATRWLPRGTGSAAPRGRLDVPGAVLVTTGLVAGTLGLSLLSSDVTDRSGWGAAVASLALLAAFVRQERRADAPLVPPSLLRRPGVVGANLTAAALTGSTTPAMLTTIFYVQDTLRLPPAGASTLYPAFNVAVVGTSLLGPRLVRRRGARLTLVTGFVAVVAGIGVLLTLPAHGRPVATLLLGFAVIGSGLGAASVASTTAGTTGVPGPEGGVAAGLLGSTAQLGSALGLAVAAPLVASAAPMAGYHRGFTAAAAVAACGAVASVLSVGRRVRAEPRAIPATRSGPA